MDHTLAYIKPQVFVLEHYRSVPIPKLPPQTIHRDSPVDQAMSLTMTRHAEPDALQYRYGAPLFDPTSKLIPNHLLRYVNDESFENISQSTPRLSYPASSPSPLPLHSSWHILPEMGSFQDTSTAGSHTVQPAYPNPAHDFARHGDYSYGRECFPTSHGYDPRALERPIDPPSASSQFAIPRGMVGQLPPRTAPRPIMYTDDAGLKLCDRVRRQCFNCKATTTTTWRRSMLNQGKLVRSYYAVLETACLKRSQVCNKCGLFERTHSVPRPKTFPRKRRSIRSSVPPNSDPPSFNHLEHRQHSDHPSVMPSTGHSPSPFGSMGSEINSQDTTSQWMTDNVPSIPPRLSPPHTVPSQPTNYHANFH